MYKYELIDYIIVTMLLLSLFFNWIPELQEQ